MKIEDISDLAAIEPPKFKPRVKFSSKSRSGLTFVVTNSDRRKWTFRYTMPTSGRRSEVAIGEYPDWDLTKAQKKALELKGLVQKGVDPAEHKRDVRQAKARAQRNKASTVPSKFRFWDLFGEWLEYQEARVAASTVNFYRATGTAHILPEFGGEDIRNLGFIDCEELILAKQDAGKSVPSRIFRTLRAFFGYCLERELVVANPLSGRKELAKSVSIEPRNRVLSPREIHKFLNELEDQHIPEELAVILMAQLTSGLRIGNVHTLRWSKIDGENGVIVHPKGEMKAKKGTRTAISEALLDLLVDWQERTPHSGDRLFDKQYDTDRVARLVRDYLSDWIPFTTHDLRRTVSTTLQRMGCPREIRQRIRNHEPPKTVDQHYDHDDQIEEQLFWLNRWGETLEALRKDPTALDTKKVDPERRRKLAKLKPKAKGKARAKK